MPAPTRLWIVLRVVDYRVQALADLDNPCWEEVSGDSIISSEREDMFQLARKYQGLLCSAEGLPSPRQASKFAAALEAVRVSLAGDQPEGTGNGSRSPANAAGTGRSANVAQALADAENRPF